MSQDDNVLYLGLTSQKSSITVELGDNLLTLRLDQQSKVQSSQHKDREDSTEAHKLYQTNCRLLHVLTQTLTEKESLKKYQFYEENGV